MRTLTLLLLAAVLVTLPVAAAESDFKAMFVKHWLVAKEFTLAVAEAMPAESYDFKPNPEELSFGQLMVHIAAQNSDSCASATGTKAPPAINAVLEQRTTPETDKQTAIKLLTLSFDKCAKELDAMTAEQWNKEVYKFQRPAGSRERSAMVYVYAYGASSRTGRSLFARKEYQAAGVAVLAFDIFAGKPSPWSSTQVKTICTIGICKGGRIPCRILPIGLCESY